MCFFMYYFTWQRHPRAAVFQAKESGEGVASPSRAPSYVPAKVFHDARPVARRRRRRRRRRRLHPRAEAAAAAAAAQVVRQAPRRLRVRWAALLHDVGKPATAAADPATGRVTFYSHERVGALMVPG
jgi:putative nucleotidyltransferase with HDIG domain